VTGEQKAPLPARDPRPVVIHFLVDSAVCFLAVIVLALIWGIPWGVVAVAALVLGAIAAPFTRRAEERQLAERAGTGNAEPPA
jgi:hypothetical protein